MIAHISGRLFRLSVIAAVVLTVLASLIQPVPASAEPELGDGYWRDTFSDSTGISTSTNITVSGGDVRLTLSSGTSTYNYVGVTRDTNDHYAYYCDEDDNSPPPALDQQTEASDDEYARISANDGDRWQTPDPGRRDYVFLEFIQQISESEQDITNIDLTWVGYGEVDGTFMIWIYNDESGSWSQLGASQEIASGSDGTLSRSITSNIQDYISASGIITWGIFFDEITTGLFSNGRWVRTNYVQAVIASSYYSTPGSLTSVSITPSNLQSWGSFSATDDNPTFCLAYRKPISITGTGTALTDYQVNIPVSYVAGMNADFSDLRFKDGSGNTLSYWIESYTASTSAQVWVKVPSIAASGTTTIYMYYGDAGASSASNGEDTFIFFDDFSGDLSKWTTHVALGTVGINTGSGYPAPCLELGGGITDGNYGFTAVGTDVSYSSFQDGIIEADIYPATDALPEIIFRGNYDAPNTGYKGRWDCRAGTETPWMIYPYSGWTGFGTAVTRFGLANQWQKAKLVISGSTFSIYSNGDFKSTVTNTTYTGPGEIGVANHYGSYVLVDNIRVRKYASTTPAVNTGSEESGTYCGFTNPGAATSITYKILNAANDSVLCTITAAQAAAGYDISSCAASAISIKLRAELSTSDPAQTPILYDWEVTWSSVIPVTIDITAPSDILSWDLAPGEENTNGGTLLVSVTPGGTNWHVTAQDTDAANTNGFMTLWEGSSYNTSVKLATAMNVSGSGPFSNEVTLPIGGTIISGTGNYSGAVTFKQFVTWEDEPGTYQIVVTFVGTVD